MNKTRKSYYPKNRALIKLWITLCWTKKDIDHSTLYSFKVPFELLHADIPDVRFLAKSAVDPLLTFCESFYFENLYISSEKQKPFRKKNKNFL